MPPALWSGFLVRRGTNSPEHKATRPAGFAQLETRCSQLQAENCHLRVQVGSLAKELLLYKTTVGTVARCVAEVSRAPAPITQKPPAKVAAQL
jgi:hypothetical protein